ncbi:uncharacterized protein LOC113792996 [Dermatophagoides pteronyssinus]
MIRNDRNRSKDSRFFIKLYKRFLKNDQGRSKILNVARVDRPKFVELTFIGSGSYADVFRSKANGNFVLKMIRLLPEELLKRIQSSAVSRHTSYFDAYQECRISDALSRLQNLIIKNRFYRCSIFPKIFSKFISKDIFLKHIESYQSFSEIECQYSIDPFEHFGLNVSRENLLMVMEDCGQLMIDIIDDLHPYAFLSILKQIIVGLMIAEQVFEFEHRDLHSGNILLQPFHQHSIQFTYDNKVITIPSYGFLVKIIDTTFSRLKYDNIIYFKDMTYLFENFEDKKCRRNNEKCPMRMQDRIYDQMSQVIQNEWQKFHPKTNCIWIKYVIYKMRKSLSIRIQQQSPNVRNKNTCSSISSLTYANRVYRLLEHFNKLMDECSTLLECFQTIINDQSGLNDFVRISFFNNKDIGGGTGNSRSKQHIRAFQYG